VENLNYYIDLFKDKRLAKEELSELATSITAGARYNVTTNEIGIRSPGTLKIFIEKDTPDFPFELLPIEGNATLGSKYLIKRSIMKRKPIEIKKTFLKQVGIIQTENPLPEIHGHNLEKEMIDIWTKNNFKTSTIHLDCDLIQKAKYTVEHSQIAHFSGHADITNKEPVFQLDGRNKIYLTINDLLHLKTCPEFIWMNACQTAYHTNAIKSWADFFLEKGCQSFIGSALPVSDSLAMYAADKFYSVFSLGETAGFAYYTMIQDLLDQGYIEAFLLRFYGSSKYFLDDFNNHV